MFFYCNGRKKCDKFQRDGQTSVTEREKAGVLTMHVPKKGQEGRRLK
jgi:hypothetical protein